MLSCDSSLFVCTGLSIPHTNTTIPAGSNPVSFPAPSRSEMCMPSGGHHNSNTNNNNNNTTNSSINSAAIMVAGAGGAAAACSSTSVPLSTTGDSSGCGSYTRGQGYDGAVITEGARLKEMDLVTSSSFSSAPVTATPAVDVVDDSVNGKNNNEEDDDMKPKSSSSNELPTPEASTDTTPTTYEDGRRTHGEDTVVQHHHHHNHNNQEQRVSNHPLSSTFETDNHDAESGVITAITCPTHVEDPHMYNITETLPCNKALTSEIDVATASLAVTLFLENLCEDNKAEPVLRSDFHSFQPPQASVKSYVDRITRYSNISGETLIVSLLLLLRYSHFVGHPVSIYNVHRLLITSVILGVKMRDDVYYSNDYYARIGGILNPEINKLEVRFCTQLAWDMWVDESTYAGFESLLREFVRLAPATRSRPSSHTTTTTTTTTTREKDDTGATTSHDDREARRAEEEEKGEEEENSQRMYWLNVLRPWKSEYEVAATQRRDRLQRIALANQNTERVKWSHSYPHTTTQYPLEEDVLVLPTAVTCKHLGTSGNSQPHYYYYYTTTTTTTTTAGTTTNTTSNSTTSGHVTVVAVPTLNPSRSMGGGSSGMGGHHGPNSKQSANAPYYYYPQCIQRQEEEEEEQQGGGGGGGGSFMTVGNNNNNNNNNNNSNNSGFGISDRALPSSELSSLSKSGISIHAKPYHYKNGRMGESMASTSRLYRDPQSTQYSGYTPQRVNAGIGRRAYYNHNYPNSSNSNSNTNSGDANDLKGSGLNASMNCTLWRSTGISGTEAHAQAAKTRPGGKKRQKPDHYQDYR